MKAFDAWQDRPVYKVQCYTFGRALKLIGMESPANGGGIATKGPHILNTFRALPPYRDESAKVLRGMVALSVRMERLQRRVGK